MTSKLKQDFQEFLRAKDHSPSPAAGEQVLAVVRSDLNPDALSVFSKVLLIHALTAVVTLSVCPQFGFRLIGEGMGLMHFFMVLGTYGCMIACGSFFTGMSLLIAGFVLRGEEIRKIRRHRLLGMGTLALLSLGFFVMMDASLVVGISLGLPAAWFAGALLGSSMTLELGWLLRFRWARRQ